MIMLTEMLVLLSAKKVHLVSDVDHTMNIEVILCLSTE